MPVEIICEREIDPQTGELTCDERLVALVDGQRRKPENIWTYLTPISRDEFEDLESARLTNPQMRATMARVNLTKGATRP